MCPLLLCDYGGLIYRINIKAFQWIPLSKRMKANTGKVAEMILFFVEFPSRWKEPIWVQWSCQERNKESGTHQIWWPWSGLRTMFSCGWVSKSSASSFSKLGCQWLDLWHAKTIMVQTGCQPKMHGYARRILLLFIEDFLIVNKVSGVWDTGTKW